MHWSLRYDSLTGVPSSQRALAFEKGSVLFNIGALYTQIGARQDRCATADIDAAIDAFQRGPKSPPVFSINYSKFWEKPCFQISFLINYLISLILCLGAFNYLKENFSNAPSLDMSAPSLSMLVRLMLAQVQECVFERIALASRSAHFSSQLRLSQEAARVSSPASPAPPLFGDSSALRHVHVRSAGVGRLPAGAADHDPASHEGLRAFFVGVHGPSQIGALPGAFTLLCCSCSLWAHMWVRRSNECGFLFFLICFPLLIHRDE